jgi:hypothetical protein
VIVYHGSGGGAVLLFLLLLFGMTFLLPLLMFRSFTRGATRVLQPTEQHGEPYPVERATRRSAVEMADVESLRHRLSYDVRTLQPGDDPVSRQAMADAAERYATCSSLLERAQSPDQLRTAWLAAAEGLHATRLVRERLGLDPGTVPTLPDAGPHLQQRTRVEVGGAEHVGAPTYEPGRSYWFPGGHVQGRYVPGGWYATAFWPGSLVLGVLGGWALGSRMSGAALGGAVAGSGGAWDGEGGWNGGGWDDVGGDW